MTNRSNRIPVILDTDIGGDIDDTWALAMLLKSPELDLKLAVSDTGNTVLRAKILGRMLEAAHRTDIPVGVGIPYDDRPRAQAPWVEGYELGDYPGTMHHDGVGAIVRTIMDSPEPMTLICIGPVPNIAAALHREPRIAEKTRFVGMHGSIYRGYRGKDSPDAECNVVSDPLSCRRVFAAPWADMIITPLDTCGQAILEGEHYAKVRDAEEPTARAVIENYRIWAKVNQEHNPDPETRSSTLFDTVAVYLAFSTEYLVMKRMGVRVTDDGYTVPDESAPKMNVAIDWEDLEAYKDFLAQRMCEDVVR